MNTKNMTQEQISAFADGEMADSHMDLVLAALRQQDSRTTWDVYHQIGDVLRSEEMGFSLSSDFASRMASRLDAEPTIVAPRVSQSMSEHRQAATVKAAISKGLVRRFAFPGVAAAAVATFALVAGPQLMTAFTGGALGDAKSTLVAVNATGSSAVASASAVSGRLITTTVAQQDGSVLRDPRIDDYLLAHQRFSPSVFSTAQYARSATFSTDSNK